jgi:shikimate kinase
MGSGKTTFGKKLANKLNYSFMDLDHSIENEHGKITDIFSEFGEPKFRNIEKQELFKTQNLRKTIIALGGGTPCSHENMSFIKKHGFSIYLKLSPKSLFSRLKSSKSDRPLIKDLSEDQLLTYIESKLDKREAFYNQCNITYSGLSADSKELIEILQKKGLSF